MKPEVRRHGISISISTIGSILGIGFILWPLIRPALVLSISAAVADDFVELVEAKTAPMQSAFKLLIKSNINKLKRDIALLSYKKEHDPENWTTESVVLLSDKRIELNALQAAYGEL